MNYWVIVNNVFCEVTVTFDHHNLISSSLRPVGCLCQISRGIPEISGSQERDGKKDGQTDVKPKNTIPSANAMAGAEA